MRSIVQQQYDALSDDVHKSRLKWLLDRNPEEYSLRLEVVNDGEVNSPDFLISISVVSTNGSCIGYRGFHFKEVPIIDNYMRKCGYHDIALKKYEENVKEEIAKLQKLVKESEELLTSNQENI